MRPHRLNVPEVYYHVTARGNNRQDIFQTDLDKLSYLKRLSEIFPSCLIRLLAYCLMTNHLHLLVQDVRGVGLPLAMRRLQGGYAQWWNRRHRRSGHVYGERYSAEPVENDTHLIAVSCYIHNNSLVAGMVKNSKDYRWSSVRAYLGGKCDIPVSTDLILDMCGGPRKYSIVLKENSPVGAENDVNAPNATKVRGLFTVGAKPFRDRIEPGVDRRAKRRKLHLRPNDLTPDLTRLWEKVYVKTGIDRNEICGRSRLKNVSRARALLCALARREGIPDTDVAHEIRRTRSAVVHLAKTIHPQILIHA